jgi:hypothetical protein
MTRTHLLARAALLAGLSSFAGCGGGGDAAPPATPPPPEPVHVAASGSDSNPGTAARPFLTLAAAVQAQSGQARPIRMAAGDFAGPGTLFGYGLSGGWSSDFSVRDPALHVTTLRLSSLQMVSRGVIEGVTLVEEAAGLGVQVVLDHQAVLRGNVINCGGAAGQADRPCVYLNCSNATGSPVEPCTVARNTIHLGAASSGISNENGNMGRSVVEENVIDGGSGENVFGIHVAGYPGPVVRRNRVTIRGDARSIRVTGIRASTDTRFEPYTVEANRVEVTSGAWTSVGIHLGYGLAVARNDVVRISGPGVAVGIGLDHGGREATRSAEISNATVFISSPVLSNGIELYDGGVVIRNNIIQLLTPQGQTRAPGACIVESLAYMQASLQDNDLFGCSTLYLDGALGPLTTLAQVNGLADVTAIGGNVSVPPALDAAADFALTSFSPVEVARGGLDLSTTFATDFAGRPRTSPWSMGAHERD